MADHPPCAQNVGIERERERESLGMAATLCAKATTELFGAILLGHFGRAGGGRCEAAPTSRRRGNGDPFHQRISGQEKTGYVCWSDLQWRDMGGVERANRTLGNADAHAKEVMETKVGCRLQTDHPLNSWMVQHCCWLHCRFHVGPDGRTPRGVLLSSSFRGGFASLGMLLGHEFQDRGCCVASSK